MPKKLPKSIRKYIRKEKARIRLEVLNLAEQDKLISGLYQRLQGKLKTNREKKSKIKNANQSAK